MMDSRRALLAPEEPKASWASRASAPPRLPVERVALFALAGASAGVGGLGGRAKSSFLLPGGSRWNAGPQAGPGVKAAILVSFHPQEQPCLDPWAPPPALATSPLLGFPGLTQEW